MIKTKKVSVAVFLFSFAAFISGGAWTFVYSKDKAREVYRSFEKFAKVYDIVKKNYVQEPTDEKLVDGAISGMLTDLDPHSTYMPREEFQEMQAETKGEFGGLGIEISKRDGYLTVVSPIEDTPAFKAGVKSGDIIVKIGDVAAATMPTEEAVKLMRGKPGEPVTITIKREGASELIPFTITRAVIQIKSVKYEVKDGFGVIHVRQFMDKSSQEVRNALNDLRQKDALKGLVLDLRNNPGGLLTQAIEISDLFLEDGLIVYTEGRDKDKVSKNYAVSKGTEPNYPVALLINGGSASASEIVAGALQDQKRAYLIGVQSFGKGSVQNVIPLEDGSGLKITVALYKTPAGRQIQGLGITPDEIVRAPGDSEVSFKEKDFPNHIVGELEKKKAEEAAKAAAKPVEKKKVSSKNLSPNEVVEDVQLNAAIAYLKSQVTTADLKMKAK